MNVFSGNYECGPCLSAHWVNGRNFQQVLSAQYSCQQGVIKAAEEVRLQSS